MLRNTLIPGRLALFAVPIAALAMLGCDNQQTLYVVQEEPGPRMAEQDTTMTESVITLMEEESPGYSASAEEGVDRPTLPAGTEMRELTMLGLAFDVPASWATEQSTSSMRAAQWRIAPVGEDDRGAEVVLFYFGEGQGGSASANVSRWIGQVDPTGEPIVYELERGGLLFTEVIVEGTLLPSTMGTGPTEHQPGSALHGLVIEGGPRGSLFFRITGDAETVRSAEAAMATLVRRARIPS